ncbi:MAG: hypothetical protein KTR13_05545 [Saprospiraceae bacterium]|nr:hypothetical protein [Saprospiraceae bacterium]
MKNTLLTTFLVLTTAVVFGQKEKINDTTIIANYILVGSSEEYHISPDDENLRHGTYNKKCSDESTVDGSYNKGEKHGTWVSRSSYGDVVKGIQYKNGQPHGKFSLYDFETGPIIKGFFVDGKKDSTWTYYGPNREVIKVGKFDKGKPVGDWVLYKDKKKKPEYVYAYDSTGLIIEPKKPYQAEFDPYLMNPLNGFEYLRLTEESNLPEGITPLGGWEYGLEQFLNNVELPGELWDTLFKGVYTISMSVNQHGAVRAHKVELEAMESFDSNKYYIPYLLLTNGTMANIKNPDHIDNTYISLGDNLLEAFYLMGPWVVDKEFDGWTTVTFQIPVKVNLDF